MSKVRLTGLDAQDPLAYLAALGCLLAVSDRSRKAGRAAPRMSFEFGAAVVPSLEGEFEDQEELLNMLAADLDALAGRGEEPRDPFLTFTYPDGGGKQVQDLKPPPEQFRAFALKLIEAGLPTERRTLDWAAATLTDVATDHSGNGKPFALHFTAGQQRFLTVALELLDGAGTTPAKRAVDREDLRLAVFGPWPNDRELKVFSWSPTQDRAYALRAVDPSSDKKLGTPGADWLALRGIGLLSSAPQGKAIVTSGVHGRWKTASFSYPAWSEALDEDGARMLLRHPAMRDLERDGEAPRGALRTLPRGVEVLSCRISRSDQGGYGAFSRPSRRAPGG
ncbi:hypothetical protein ENSA5_16920 [Enhygromyxa salina]|uniref:Uncharacterized protein n=1 Tax=Enhygromyxa salina TaxID=215803 RepID=A0A2S9YDZ3_9BACT|nr:hypothetical protein [Enhygromyxa salina]PRQ03338.1 hypothetical protein ENSA5_16920 [Enhygromyxa salina]